METAVFGGESDPQFARKGWTDVTEFGTVEKTMYDFPSSGQLMVSLARCHTVEEEFHFEVKFYHFRDGVVPFKTVYNLNRSNFRVPIFASRKCNVATF